VLTRASAALAVGALLAAAAGCGGTAHAGKSEDPYTCLLRLQATARANTIVALYRQGKLGSRVHLEHWAGRKLPFLDRDGRVIPSTQMSERQALRMDDFALKATSWNVEVLVTVEDAVTQARVDAKKRCS
jgi:hypothetical protein